jgi:hypothetical protein
MFKTLRQGSATAFSMWISYDTPTIVLGISPIFCRRPVVYLLYMDVTGALCRIAFSQVLYTNESHCVLISIRQASTLICLLFVETPASILGIDLKQVEHSIYWPLAYYRQRHWYHLVYLGGISNEKNYCHKTVGYYIWRPT